MSYLNIYISMSVFGKLILGSSVRQTKTGSNREQPVLRAQAFPIITEIYI